MQYRKDAMLAAHVVRARRDRPQGRPAQHELRRAKAQEVSQVGLAAGKLAHRQRPLRALQMGAQIGFEPAGLEALVRALADQLGRFESCCIHFRNSTRATARLWTSSGPSTMRMMRERAQASARPKSAETPAPPCAWIAR